MATVASPPRQSPACQAAAVWTLRCPTAPVLCHAATAARVRSCGLLFGIVATALVRHYREHWEHSAKPPSGREALRSEGELLSRDGALVRLAWMDEPPKHRPACRRADRTDVLGFTPVTAIPSTKRSQARTPTKLMKWRTPSSTRLRVAPAPPCRPRHTVNRVNFPLEEVLQHPHQPPIQRSQEAAPVISRSKIRLIAVP